MYRNKGITLIALVITIIILMIITAVSVTMALKGGLFDFSRKARISTEDAIILEDVYLAVTTYRIEKETGNTNASFKHFANAYLTCSHQGERINNFYIDSFNNCFRFNYKNRGFKVDIDSYEIELNQEMVAAYKKINNVNELQNNQNILIVSYDSNNKIKVLGEDNTNNRKSLSDDYITVKADSIYLKEKSPLVLKKDATNWNIIDTQKNNYYFTATKSDNNYLKTTKNKDENAVFSIDVNDIATIKSINKSSRNVIQYNQISDLFSCYNENTQTPVYIYGSTTEIGTKMPVPTNIIATTNPGEGVKIVWDKVDHANGYIVTVINGNSISGIHQVAENYFESTSYNNGTTYKYTVSAITEDEDYIDSEPSEIQYFTPNLGVYTIINNISELSAGSRYILVYSSDNEIGTVLDEPIINENIAYRDGKEITISNEKINYLENYALLLGGDRDNGWTFFDTFNKCYLMGTDNNNINLGISNVINNYTKFGINFEQNLAKIDVLNNSNFYIQYNKNINAKRFSCYQGTQENIYIYKEVTQKINLEKPDVETTLGTTTATLTWDNVRYADKYMLYWNGSKEGIEVTSPYTVNNLSKGEAYSYKLQAVVSDSYSTGFENSEYVQEPITISSKDNLYIKIDSEDNLNVGDKYIIVSYYEDNNTYYVLNNYVDNAKNIQAIAITPEIDGGIIYEGDYVITLQNGETNSYLLYVENKNGYLASNSGTSENVLKLSSNSTGAGICAYFTITFDEDKHAIITCTGKSSRNIMRFNINMKNGVASPIFSCYTSGQAPIYLYKLME